MIGPEQASCHKTPANPSWDTSLRAKVSGGDRGKGRGVGGRKASTVLLVQLPGQGGDIGTTEATFQSSWVSSSLSGPRDWAFKSSLLRKNNPDTHPPRKKKNLEGVSRPTNVTNHNTEMKWALKKKQTSQHNLPNDSDSSTTNHREIGKIELYGNEIYTRIPIPFFLCKRDYGHKRGHKQVGEFNPYLHQSQQHERQIQQGKWH